mgnify:CR=1 FL=1
MEKPAAACYHLPGLFEFYELYRRFLPLYREHREYFYDWCTIGSIYGAPAGDASPAAGQLRARCWRCCGNTASPGG